MRTRRLIYARFCRKWKISLLIWVATTVVSLGFVWCFKLVPIYQGIVADMIDAVSNEAFLVQIAAQVLLLILVSSVIFFTKDKGSRRLLRDLAGDFIGVLLGAGSIAISCLLAAWTILGWCYIAALLGVALASYAAAFALEHACELLDDAKRTANRRSRHGKGQSNRPVGKGQR